MTLPRKSPSRVRPDLPVDGNVVRLYEEGSLESAYTALMAIYGLPFASPQKNKYADAAVIDYQTALCRAEGKLLRKVKAMREAGMDKDIPPDMDLAAKAVEAKREAARKMAEEAARKAGVVRDTIDL